MKINDLQWKLCGEAGFGVMATGEIFARVCTRGGLYICDHAEFPSRIRGGRNTYTVRVSEKEIYSHIRPVDILVALDKEAIEDHQKEVVPGGALIYDSGEIDIDEKDLRKDISIIPIPMKEMCEKHGAPVLMRNNLALGASLGLLTYDFEILRGAITQQFQRKGDKVVDLNIEVAKAGYDHAQSMNLDFKYSLEKIKAPQKMNISGNEAIALGAIKAGLQFHAQYPMTPSSAILHYLAQKELDYGLVVKQCEDELAVINMAAGAAFAGARAMCATSGGGFCLMTEGVGLAGMIEVPVVIVMGQRTGPSTGLPTWTEQGDIRLVLHASQGDFPRIVLAPGDMEECFYLAGEAFNLADRYQTPVIIVTDKYLAEDHWSVPKFDPGKINIDRGKMVSDEFLSGQKEFLRYDYSIEDGVSPRSIPGQKGGIYTATSDEHDQNGMLCEEQDNRKRMSEKRWKKLLEAEKSVPPPQLFGPQDAKITIVAWGSNKGVVREALKMLEKEGIKAKFIHLNYINPFPADEVKNLLEKAGTTFMVENNISGQMHGYIREKTGIEIQHKILKYDGRPFFPEEIVKGIKEVL